MSFFDGIAQHRAGSPVVEQRRVFAGSIVDAGSLPALRKANRRLRRRRIGFDLAIGALVTVPATVLLLVGLVVIG